MEEFEKKIRKYFRKRELDVSDDAWIRMEALLDGKVDNKGKKNIRFVWTIAASFVVAAGLWTFFKKVQFINPGELESKPVFVVNDTVTEKLKEDTGNKTYVNSSNRRSEKMVQKPVLQNIKEKREKHTEIQQQLGAGEKLQEAVAVSMPSEPQGKQEVIASVPQQVPSRIYVNPNKLLRNADIERQLDNVVTDGKNFWNKVKEINTVVENSN